MVTTETKTRGPMEKERKRGQEPRIEGIKIGPEQ
jgi:hypothetical protein